MGVFSAPHYSLNILKWNSGSEFHGRPCSVSNPFRNCKSKSDIGNRPNLLYAMFQCCKIEYENLRTSSQHCKE